MTGSKFAALELLGRDMRHDSDATRMVLFQLRMLHDSIDWDCPARSEGQRCCLDHLLDGPDP